MFAIFYQTVENRKMNKQQFLHRFNEALRESGVDVDELMNKDQSETAITVHWTDGKIRTGYFEGEGGEVLYLKAHVRVGDKYIADNKLITTGEEAFDELQSVANHFKTLIEPLELNDLKLINWV
tara:strand:- start:20 stop:391 length:372 start_codon:yes stop_codon:yes gene_type:complete